MEENNLNLFTATEARINYQNAMKDIAKANFKNKKLLELLKVIKDASIKGSKEVNVSILEDKHRKNLILSLKFLGFSVFHNFFNEPVLGEYHDYIIKF